MLYGYPSYGNPPLTPPRLSRPSTSTPTSQTPGRSQPGSALLSSTPGTARSSTTVTAPGTGIGDGGYSGPALVTYTTISQEYASLRYPGHCPLGMYLIPDKESLFVWDGVFFVHQGASLGRVFCNRRSADAPLFSLCSHSALHRGPLTPMAYDCLAKNRLGSSRLLLGLHPEIPPRVPKRLPRLLATNPIPDGRLPPIDLPEGRELQPRSAIQTLEASGFSLSPPENKKLTDD